MDKVNTFPDQKKFPGNGFEVCEIAVFAFQDLLGRIDQPAAALRVNGGSEMADNILVEPQLIDPAHSCFSGIQNTHAALAVSGTHKASVCYRPPRNPLRRRMHQPQQ